MNNPLPCRTVSVGQHRVTFIGEHMEHVLVELWVCETERNGKYRQGHWRAVSRYRQQAAWTSAVERARGKLAVLSS
jgi:hypothetical protein